MKRNSIFGVVFLLVAAIVFRSDGHERIVYSQSTSPATAPLYRLHNFDTDQYVLTTDANELAMFVSQGWTYEKIIGYAFTSSTPLPPNVRSLSPLYRVYNSQTGEYIEGIPSTVPQQPSPPWRVDAVLGYVIGKPGANQQVVMRADNASSSSSIIVSDPNELVNLSSDWARRFAFYIPDMTNVGNSGWPKQLGTVGDEGIGRILVDHSGSIYLIGYTDGNLFGQSSTSNQCFVAKYDASGNLLWGKQFGSSTTDTASSACVDSNNNLYVVGDTSGNLFGTNAGGADGYVTKLSPSGDTIWSKQFGTSSSDFANDVAVDGQDDVYIAGDTEGNLYGPNSSTHPDLGGVTDAYIVEYDANGNPLWNKQIGDGGLSSVGP